MKKKLPDGSVPFEGATPQRKTSPGPGGRAIPMPSNDVSLNDVVRRDPPGVRRSGNDPRGKVAHENVKGRRGIGR
jgi:hypothetical protein